MLVIVPPLCAVVDVRLMINPTVVIVGKAEVVVVLALFLQLLVKKISDKSTADNDALRK